MLKAKLNHLLKIKNTEIKAKKEIIKRLRTLKVSDNLPNLVFNSVEEKDETYIQYMNHFLVKDITKTCIREEGELTILKVIANKNIEINSHEHTTQSQTIYINEGVIVDLTTGLSFTKGQSFFSPKKQNHKLKYLKDTIATVVFLPNLELISNE